MATLSENISQAIHDFDDIKSAIEYKGVEVPVGTATREYSEKIKEIPGQDPPAGTIDITENGNYDVSTYAEANVDVPTGIFPEGTLTIETNGQFDISNYQYVNVQLALPSGEIEITENGQHNVMQYEIADVDVYTYVDELTQLIEGTIEHLNIPNTVTHITSYVLCQENLKSISIPDSVKSIDSNAFYAYGKGSFPEIINIPDNLEYSGYSSLEDTQWYQDQPYGDVYAGKVYIGFKGSMLSNTEIIIKEGTLAVGGSALSRNEITSVVLPSTLKTLGDRAFEHCENLTDINIPAGLTTIGGGAFSYCNNLRLDIKDLPNSITYIGSSAFHDYNFEDTLVDGVNYIGKVLYKYKGDMDPNTEIVVKDGTTQIMDSAFEGYTNLISILIPDSVRFIGNDAFRGCTNLQSINLPNNLSNYYPNFRDCTNLISINIPEGITELGSFTDCTSLSNIQLPESLKHIHMSCFSGCSSLLHIDLPDSLQTMNMYCFSNSGLQSIRIKSNIKFPGVGAFKDCTDLISAILEPGVQEITAELFQNCRNLEVVSIPVSTKFIGSNAFYECWNLSDVYYEGTQEQWNSILIDSNNQDLLSATIHYNELLP